MTTKAILLYGGSWFRQSKISTQKTHFLLPVSKDLGHMYLSRHKQSHLFLILSKDVGHMYHSRPKNLISHSL